MSTDEDEAQLIHGHRHHIICKDNENDSLKQDIYRTVLGWVHVIM